MKDITHIERPNLPWRTERRTECNLDAEKHPTWKREEAVAKAKELGKQRFSMFVCMTCMHTAERHSTWEDNPASCLHRYCERYGGQWGRSWPQDDKPEEREFLDELRAIAMLIEEHREEFDQLVAGLGSTTDLDAQRSIKRARKRYAE